MANRERVIVALVVLVSGLMLNGCGNQVAEFHDTVSAVTFRPVQPYGKKWPLEKTKRMLAENPKLLNAKRHGETPLHTALGGAGRVDIVQFLIASGADVNAKNKRGETPLHKVVGTYVVHKGKALELVKLLIDSGAEINAKDNRGSTPLHEALGLGPDSPVFSKEIVELLITNGSDVNAKDNKGRTPLDTAVRWGHKEIADLLRKHGGVE